jgi:hypothetical protein
VDANEERIARNEVLFREVNERIKEVAEGPDAAGEPALVLVCECGREGCAEQIELTRAQYEAVRANPRRFVVLPGHEDPDVARVVERHQGFVVAEKLDEAGEIAAEHDPRS